MPVAHQSRGQRRDLGDYHAGLGRGHLQPLTEGAIAQLHMLERDLCDPWVGVAAVDCAEEMLEQDGRDDVADVVDM